VLLLFTHTVTVVPYPDPVPDSLKQNSSNLVFLETNLTTMSHTPPAISPDNTTNLINFEPTLKFDPLNEQPTKEDFEIRTSNSTIAENHDQEMMEIHPHSPIKPLIEVKFESSADAIRARIQEILKAVNNHAKVEATTMQPQPEPDTRQPYILNDTMNLDETSNN